MDFGVVEFDEATSAFRAEVSAFCDAHLTQAVYDEEYETGSGFNLEFHRALGDRGWIVPTWSHADGGADLSPLEAALLARELTERRGPSNTMGTTQLVLPAVVQWAGDELRAEILPRVARGDVRLCLGYTEPDSGSDIAAAKTRATRDGDEWVIDGQKMFTTGAQNCQYAFLITRTNPTAPKHKGLTMFLCPLDDAAIQPIRTLGGERTNLVFFDSVRISDRYRLGPVDDGWTVLMGPLNAEHALGEQRPEEQLELAPGVLGEALAAAINWARAADPQGHRPIDDPLVATRLARVALDLELYRTSTGPMGHVLKAEILIRDSNALFDLVGSRALLPRGEVDAIGNGVLEYTHRYAQGNAIYGGSTDIHRNIIAERMLGLPRSTPKQ